MRFLVVTAILYVNVPSANMLLAKRVKKEMGKNDGCERRQIKLFGLGKVGSKW